ncbi:MAG: patatin-like phospholipase family protein, partial [Proteobacteria bacterium]|nr:patatin-like phospholipase family protein [Pseudomonadota bacterium]
TISMLNEESRNKLGLKQIDSMIIKPSVDVRDITAQHAKDIPRPVRTLLKMIGGWGKDWRMPSYLLFEPGYTQALIDLGYQDALQQKDEIIDFLKTPN